LKCWMVRASRGSVLYDAFLEQGLVAVGWSDIGDLSDYSSIEVLREDIRRAYPEYKPVSVGTSTGMLWRLAHDMNSGDLVLTYDQTRRMYSVGRISGSYAFVPDGIPNDIVDEQYRHTRPVKWIQEVPRDDLSTPSRNQLGSLLSIFRLDASVTEEFLRIIEGSVVDAREPDEQDAEAYEDAQFDSVESRSLEFIKDMLAQLDANEMEEFVAGLLRALGYKTQVSPIGPDRGQDILASPDYLGLEDPRVVVEVKHRKGSIGSQDIRSFLGGRHPNDKGLYVSTGGFTKDARYEADRASIPLKLMTSDDLVKLLVQHYESLDLETRSMVPLRKVYWPIS